MIIKSVGRKASSFMTGGGRGSPFMKLVRYMTRSEDGEKSQSVLWHGFYGHEGMTPPEIVAAFEENARLLKERKNGNVLYHEILSFSAGYRLQGEALARAVADIGQEYLRLRAAKQMAFGAVHWDTDHIHLHLMVSANEIGKRERVRLSKADFAEVQKAVEGYTLTHYPELGQTRIYGRERAPERLKTQVHEQAMKARTGAPSRKEALKARLHSLFERAANPAELSQLLQAEGVELYTRGQSTGVMVRDADGTERRHRLSSLGIMAHYQATQERFAGPDSVRAPSRPTEPAIDQPQHPHNDKEQNMAPDTKLGGPGGTVWGMPPPTAPEIVAEEFATGKLHPDWHGQPSAEVPQVYTDDILKKLQERDADRVPPPPSRGRDDDDSER